MLFCVSLLLCLLLVGVSGQQGYCRVDGYDFPCPRIVESLYLDYRIYGNLEAVAYIGLPVGRPLDIIESLYTGTEFIHRYFDGGNRANVTIPHTYPRAIFVDFVTHRYIPLLFLPQTYIGRAPGSAVANVVIGGVDPLGSVEPISVPLFERPTDARLREAVIATHTVLRQHGETYNPNVFVFASYDLPDHRGPTYNSELWVFPAPAATNNKIKVQ